VRHVYINLYASTILYYCALLSSIIIYSQIGVTFPRLFLSSIMATRPTFTKQHYFKQWLTKLTGTYVPKKPLEPIITQIKHYLDSSCCTDNEESTPNTGRWYSRKDIRRAIRRLNIDGRLGLYDYDTHIQAALTGISLPVLSTEQYEQCVVLVREQLSTTRSIRKLAEQVIKQVAMPWKQSIQDAVVYCLHMVSQVNASGASVSLETDSLEEARNRLKWLQSRWWIQKSHGDYRVSVDETPVLDAYIVETNNSDNPTRFSQWTAKLSWAALTLV